VAGATGDRITLDPAAFARSALRHLISSRTGRPLTPASTNKTLGALRGVLREAWRLGQMSAEDDHRATDLERVSGSTVLRGRALGANETAALFHLPCTSARQISRRCTRCSRARTRPRWWWAPPRRDVEAITEIDFVAPGHVDAIFEDAASREIDVLIFDTVQRFMVSDEPEKVKTAPELQTST